MTIAIIGSGFAGLGMAIRLLQAGIQDFVIYERANTIGGTWRDQIYPGCACDVEAILYSLASAPSAEWSKMYAPQPEILKYMQEVVRRFDLLKYIRFEHELTAAVWENEQRHWQLTTSKGVFTAQILIAAMGPFDAPNIPKLPGLVAFKGPVMHSARWRPEVPLAGKRVGVIGTGASAIQIIPEIQPIVAQLTLFQRTPAWVVARTEQRLSERKRAFLRRHPQIQRLWRQLLYYKREFMGLAFRQPKLRWAPTLVATAHLRSKVKSPELRAKLTPQYGIGCKRILLSNDYYPALQQANAAVVTEAIEQIDANGIITSDGVYHPIDVLLLCTGFQISDAPYMRIFRGREGKTLDEVWRGSPRAFLGTTVPAFPNLFILQGPNTGLGHTSVLLMVETQVEHVLGAIRHLQAEAWAAIEPRAAVVAAYNAEVARQSQRTVWIKGGCASYYLDKEGANSAIWPGSVGAFRQRVARFRPQDYERTN